MGYNPLANRPTTAGVPPRPRPKTAQEAIIEMLKQRAANPTAAPTVSPSIASSLTNNQKPSATVRDTPQLQKLAQDMNLSPTATVQKAYTSTQPEADQSQEEQVQPKPYKPNYGQAAANTAANVGTNYLANSIDDTFAGSAPAAPAVVDAGFTGASPAAPTVVDAGFTGATAATNAAPSTPTVIGAGYPAASNTFGTLGGVAPALGLAGQAYYYGQQGLDAYKKIQDGRTRDAGWLKGAMLTNPITAWAAPAVDFLGISSGKHPDQYQRDAVRDRLKEIGMIDDGYNLTNTDGTKFDIGKDGSIKNYNLDFNKDGIGDIVGLAQGLAAFITGGDEKATSDLTGYMVNAAMQSGDPRANLLKYAADAKIDHDTAYGGINALAGAEENPLDRDRADAYLNGLDQLFGTGAYAEGSGESSGGKKKSKSKGSSKSEDKPITPIAPPVPKDSPPPQTSQPVSGDDYVQAIVAVNDANSVNKKKRKNPLSNGFY